jgi:hypothetical protein
MSRAVGGWNLTMMFDDCWDELQNFVDLGIGDVFGQAEAEGGFGVFAAEAHGGEDVGGFDRSRRACRAAGDSETAEVEGDEEGFAIDVVEGDVGGVGDAGRAGSVDGDGVLQALDEAGFEAIAEGGYSLWDAVGDVSKGELGSLAEAGDSGYVFGAGAALALVGSAKEKGLERRAGLDPGGHTSCGRRR